MITSVHIRNFKTLKDTGPITLDDTVVLIGPNNSGKTSILQALSLWHLGLEKWLEKRPPKSKAKERSGVQINRKDLFAIPVKSAKLLWNDLFVQESRRDEEGKITETKKVNIEILVQGITDGKKWNCALEFEHRGDEVLYVRPYRGAPDNTIFSEPELLQNISIAFLPPMSGLKTNEVKLLPQTVEARIGEGLTAEVLRNLCYQVINPETALQKGKRDPKQDWANFQKIIKDLFYIDLHEPILDVRGEFEMFYTDHKGSQLEIASAGRGLQQIILLLSYFFVKPNTTILLDEPDAHLEILKQKEVYNLLKSISARMNTQIISASHSEVIMREAAEEDVIIAIYPSAQPHIINDAGKELIKSLRDISIQDYYLAQLKGRILYLEGSTDRAMLKAFALKLHHPLAEYIDKSFVFYINTNDLSIPRKHYSGLLDAFPGLKGMVLLDKQQAKLNQLPGLTELMWSYNEFENYFFSLDILRKFAADVPANDLFASAEKEKRIDAMEKAIEDIIPGIARKEPDNLWWREQIASYWLAEVFKYFYKNMNLPNPVNKNKFHELILYTEDHKINLEVKDKIDSIYSFLTT